MKRIKKYFNQKVKFIVRKMYETYWGKRREKLGNVSMEKQGKENMISGEKVEKFDSKKNIK